MSVNNYGGINPSGIKPVANATPAINARKKRNRNTGLAILFGGIAAGAILGSTLLYAFSSKPQEPTPAVSGAYIRSSLDDKILTVSEHDQDHYKITIKGEAIGIAENDHEVICRKDAYEAFDREARRMEKSDYQNGKINGWSKYRGKHLAQLVEETARLSDDNKTVMTREDVERLQTCKSLYDLVRKGLEVRK